jgi:hypothetical protein
MLTEKKKLHDTKWVIRWRISQDRQYNGLKYKDKRLKNHLQNITQKTTDPVIRTSLKTGDVSSFCSTWQDCECIIYHVKNLFCLNEPHKNRKVNQLLFLQWHPWCYCWKTWLVGFMVFNATFSNISVISLLNDTNIIWYDKVSFNKMTRQSTRSK